MEGVECKESTITPATERERKRNPGRRLRAKEEKKNGRGERKEYKHLKRGGEIAGVEKHRGGVVNSFSATGTDAAARVTRLRCARVHY